MYCELVEKEEPYFPDNVSHDKYTMLKLIKLQDHTA